MACTVDQVRIELFKIAPVLNTTDATELASLNCLIDMVIKCTSATVWCGLQCTAAALHSAHFYVLVGAISDVAPVGGSIKREETEFSEYEYHQVIESLSTLGETSYGRAYLSLKASCVINQFGFLIDC